MERPSSEDGIVDIPEVAHEPDRDASGGDRQSAGGIATSNRVSGAGLTDTDRKSRKRFNPTLDVILLREVGAREPYAAPHGKVNETWEEVTSALNNSGSFPWKVDSRMARDRFVILERWLKRQDSENLKRGSGEVFELREQLLNEVVTRKDSFHIAKEEKRGDRDGVRKDRLLTPVLSLSDRKREYGADSDPPDSKRSRESHVLEEVMMYLKEKDSSLRAFERKRLELDELRMQADIEDQKKQRELEEKRLEIETIKVSQQSEERKLLYQILETLQEKLAPANPEETTTEPKPATAAKST